MKMFRKEEGFTLVELMVVVLIIGILVAIAVPVFLNASANAQAKSCQANQRTWNGAVQTYNASANTVLDVTTAETLGGTVTGVVFTSPNATMKSVPKCPAGDAYTVGTTETITSDQAAGTGWETAAHQLQ